MRQRTSSLFAVLLFATGFAPLATAKLCTEEVGAVAVEARPVSGLEGRLAHYQLPPDRAAAARTYLANIEGQYRERPEEDHAYAGTPGRDALLLMISEDRTLSDAQRLETLEGIGALYASGGAVVVSPSTPGDAHYTWPTSTRPARIGFAAPPSLQADGPASLHHEIRHANDFTRLLRRFRAAHPTLTQNEAIDRLALLVATRPSLSRFLEDRALRDGPLAIPAHAGYGIEMQLIAMGRAGTLDALERGSPAHRELVRLLEAHANLAPPPREPPGADVSPLLRELMRPNPAAPSRTFTDRAPHLLTRTDRYDVAWRGTVEAVWRRDVLPGFRRRTQLALAAETRRLGLSPEAPTVPQLLRDTARFWLARRGARPMDGRFLATVADDVSAMFDLPTPQPRNVMRILENGQQKPWAEYRRAVETLFAEDTALTAEERDVLLPTLLGWGMERCPDFATVPLDTPTARYAFHLALRNAILTDSHHEEPGFAAQLARIATTAETRAIALHLAGAAAGSENREWADGLASLRGRR